jgi:hypothetical protein
MRRNLSQNGEESFGGRREILREPSAILRFDSSEGIELPSGPGGKQQESSLTRSTQLKGMHGPELSGQGSNKFPYIPLLDNATITISVIEGRSKGLTYQLRKFCITAGRIGGGADFEFDELEAFDVHCFVAARPDSVRLYAAPSVDNIYVNDQPISTVELTNASTFRVGSTLLRVSILPDQPADIRKSGAAEK